MIELDASPHPVSLDPARCAVLVVDMQNDFGARGGMFDRAGIDITGIERVVPRIGATLDAARRADIAVVYLKMGFRPDLSDLGAPGSPNRDRHLRFGVGETVVAPDGRESRILVRDTWNTEILPALTPAPGDLVLYKTRYSGFFETDLHAHLQRAKITQLVVTGCTTSVCVDSTVRDAMFRDYACIVLADCTSEPIGAELPRSNHDATLLTTELLFGWTSDSARFAAALAHAAH